MRKGLIKKLLLVLLPLAVMGVLAALDPSVADIGTVLEVITPGWFALALLSIVAYYLLDTHMYLLACRFMETPQKYGEGLLTTMYGFFYSALTPFASGGQPMQLLQMRRRGMKIGASTSILVLKFLAWQLAITCFGVAGFIVLWKDFLSARVSVLLMYIVGFLAFLGSVLLAALVLLKPGWVHRAGEAILRLLTRMRILRKEEKIAKLHADWARTIGDFGDAMHFALKHRMGMLLIFLTAVLAALAYMAVTYFIYRGLGFAAYNIWHVMLLQGLLYISVSFVPLPGASIASEGGFYLVFAELLTPAARFPAMLLWRLITYYSSLFFGFIAVFIDGLRNPARPGSMRARSTLPPAATTIAVDSVQLQADRAIPKKGVQKQ